MSRFLGVLTIGQAPRPDGLARDVAAVVGPGLTVVERGALDGLSRDDIAALRPDPGDYHLVTMLADGTPVQLRKPAILERLQARIAELERAGVAGTLLLCTGAFPAFHHDRPLLLPQGALYGAAIGVAGGGRVGALVPLAAQLPQARDKWRALGVADPALAVANPYDQDAARRVAEAAAEAREAGAAVLFMDCFGYDLGMRDAARAAFGGPVLLARSLAARLMAEVLA
ncbi:MAG TPA: AroM family protein [Thermomicrobiales bacterium]|nr:AroM family protein [Thermomicrobiales bacterium]